MILWHESLVTVKKKNPSWQQNAKPLSRTMQETKQITLQNLGVTPMSQSPDNVFIPVLLSPQKRHQLSFDAQSQNPVHLLPPILLQRSSNLRWASSHSSQLPSGAEIRKKREVRNLRSTAGRWQPWPNSPSGPITINSSERRGSPQLNHLIYLSYLGQTLGRWNDRTPVLVLPNLHIEEQHHPLINTTLVF